MSSIPLVHTPSSRALPGASVSTDRESSIDFARGTAMLLVFLAHFSQELTIGPPASGLPLLLQQIGMVASPTFVLVSGLTLAYVLGCARPEMLRQAQLRIFDRALFILIIVHLVLTVSDVLLAPYQRGIRQFFITDLVALNLMVGLILVPRLGPGARLAIGALLYSIGWITHALLHPVGIGFVAVAEEILTGPTVSHALDYGFPVFEWAGVFLLGTVLGETLASARTPDARRRWATRLLWAGASAVVIAVMIKAIVLTSPIRASIAVYPAAREFLSIFGKAPPSPIYLMFFGGLGTCIIAGATLLSGNGLAVPVNEWVSVLGRNSLFVFVLQSVVFRDLVARVPLEGRSWAWPLAFVTATLVIWSGARVWDRLGGNRWFTLGIAQLATAGSLQVRRT